MAWALASEKILTKTKDVVTKIPNFVISIIYVALFIMVLRLINMIPKSSKSYISTTARKKKYSKRLTKDRYRKSKAKYPGEYSFPLYRQKMKWFDRM